MTNIDIRALAKLARVEVTDAEVDKLEKELPAILDFVETVQGARVSATAPKSALRNVMREDANPHEGGVYTDALLKGAPSEKDGRIVVKQVISRKQK